MPKRRGPTTPRRTDAELIKCATPLAYEIWMLAAARKHLDELAEQFRRGAEHTPETDSRHNEALESFLIHARLLIDFLYLPADRAYESDVLAEDFFDDPAQWHAARLSQTPLLEQTREAVHLAVAHLSDERLAGNRLWPWNNIERELIERLRVFRDSVPLHRLSSHAQNLLKQLR
jgi:hypothetical protein